MNRKETIDAAAQTVIDRQATHGDPKDNFQIVADLWSTYLCIEDRLEPKDVAALMVLLKIARSRLGHSDDHAVDMCGYAALMNELV
jgi:hypothetical protein